MKAVIQRVKKAVVKTNGKVLGEISKGLLIFLGVAEEDTEDDIKILGEKIRNLRIFSDDEGKLNLTISDIKGEFLVVSQFTLLADCRKGRRPNFSNAATKEKAYDYYKKFIQYLRQCGEKVAEGEFQAYMEVELINDGPVTIILDSEDLKKTRRQKE
ncbi:MAG: D-aminoacyl-tRNA deacylase [Dictyoglomaceae bacterium]|nr:D-aminoacyl-tRNA deacylase [Dictyoglomaceae bacterium]